MDLASARVRIDRERRLHQLGPMVDQPLHAIGLQAAALLVVGEGDHDVLVRRVALLLEADEGSRHGRNVRLHVRGAAAVEPAVLLREGEWIEAPVLPHRGHDVEVHDVQDRLRLALTPEARDQVLLVWERAGHGQLGPAEPCGAEATGDHLCRGCGPLFVGRVDCDQLGEDLARERPPGGGELRFLRGRGGEERQGEQERAGVAHGSSDNRFQIPCRDSKERDPCPS